MRNASLSILALVVATACTPPPAGDDYGERMAREHRDDAPVASDAALRPPAAEVDGADVIYAEVDGRPVTGYLARPAEGGEGAPGLIVIHEWWGLNDNIRSMARRLAGQGYLALAVDLYGGRTASTPEDARRLMQDSTEREKEVEDNLVRAARFLENEHGAQRIGVIGWCFGGGWALRAGLLMPDRLDAVVIYYGRLITDPDRLADLDAPLLGLFGGQDRGIPLESVREFESVLGRLGKDATIRVYDGADHAFANPSGTRYDPEAADDAWERTVAFLDAHLAGEHPPPKSP